MSCFKLEDLEPGKHIAGACCSPEWRIGPDVVIRILGKSHRTHRAAGTNPSRGFGPDDLIDQQGCFSCLGCIVLPDEIE